MSGTSAHELALLRLVAQRLVGPQPGDAAAAVRWMTAVQAQDFRGALSSVGLRTAERDRSAVVAALDSGALVRSWPMRGTLHLVAAEDLRWLLDLCAARVLAGAAQRRDRLGLAPADLDRARALAAAALGGGRRLSRAGLLRRFEDGGVATAGQRGYHLLHHLALQGILCLGPTGEDGQQLFVLAEDWLPAPAGLDPEQARAGLALRFFRSHGPAPVTDLARWAGLRLRDARSGLAAVRAQLAVLDHRDQPHYLDPATSDLLADHRQAARGTFLLPGFDEFLIGYTDRGFAVPAEFFDRIVPGGNGVFRATIVHDGAVVGTWRWDGSPSRRRLVTEPFNGLPLAVGATLDELAAGFP